MKYKCNFTNYNYYLNNLLLLFKPDTFILPHNDNNIIIDYNIVMNYVRCVINNISN